MGSMYDQNIVLDLEFTPSSSEARRMGLRYEVIQIGAVRVAPDGRLLDSFTSYIRPQFANDIASKVKLLTGIRRSDVCDADAFCDVMGRFGEWIGAGTTRFVAWSPSDYAQLAAEVSCKGAAFPVRKAQWLDLQKVYPRLMGVGRKGRSMALKTAAEWCGAAVSEELLHGALYDATVTARLLGSVLAGEYVQQKKVLAGAMCVPSERETLSASIGSRFAGLAELKASLMRQEAALACA